MMKILFLFCFGLLVVKSIKVICKYNQFKCKNFLKKNIENLYLINVNVDVQYF